MKNKDQKAIFESYREEILKKFKQSLENDKGDQDQSPLDIESSDSDSENSIQDSGKEMVFKSDEIAVNMGPKLRAIVRNLPDEFEYNDSLAVIQKAIRIASAEIDEEIKDSPLKIYDKLTELDILSKEVVKDSEEDIESETGVLMNFNDDDYSDEEDDNNDSRKDALKGEAEEIIRQMGTDWRKHDEDYISSNY